MAKRALLQCRLLLGVLLVLALADRVVCRAVQTGDYQSTEQSEEQEVVDELQSFLPVRDGSSSPETPAQDTDLCATIFCGNGRKCVLENGRPTCGCALTCPDHYKPICGSDGVTYQNPCELHRASCLQNIKIHKHLRGPCPAPPPTLEPPVEEEKPLVCFEIERDQLRQLLIDWMKGRVEQDKERTKDKSYAQVLTENFRGCDLDADDQLSGSEFIQCVEKNETVAEFTGKRPEHGHVLRGLCVDALILMSDTNEDWMLDLEEFLRCMDPAYEPPRKQCSLENKMYEDGAETRVDCNICVCACGNWVCSAMSCDEIDDYNLFEPYDVEQGPLPSKEERYALLRGFMAAEHVNLDRVEEEVPPPVLGEGPQTGVLFPTEGSQEGVFPPQQNHGPEAPHPAGPVQSPDTVPLHLPTDTPRPAEDIVEGMGESEESAGESEESLGESEESVEESEESSEELSQEHQPSQAPGQAMSATHEADGNAALQEFLASETVTTTTTTTTTTSQSPPESTTRHHQQEVVQPEQHSIPQTHPKPQEQDKEPEQKPDVSSIPDVQEEHKVVPDTPTEEATPVPTPAPARRFIPVVNFNITVAEHRVIHMGDPERTEEINVRSERIHQDQNAPRHGEHDNNHEHPHHRKDHHSHHHNHHHGRSHDQGEHVPVQPAV